MDGQKYSFKQPFVCLMIEDLSIDRCRTNFSPGEPDLDDSLFAEADSLLSFVRSKVAFVWEGLTNRQALNFIFGHKTPFPATADIKQSHIAQKMQWQGKLWDFDILVKKKITSGKRDNFRVILI